MAAAWECPCLPMIHLPLKESSKANYQSLKPLIASCYEENPDSFSDEIKQLEQLRESALKPARDYNGCNIIRRYYSQLHLLMARFPDKIKIQFPWKDAFTNGEYKVEGLQIEMTSLLYNIGALHSQVGSKDGRHTEQDMKEALTHFQCAAGTFQYFLDNLTSCGCADMSPQLIEMYKNLMLAQAQECAVEKSLKGLSRVKNLNISKISMKVAQYYQSVVLVLEGNAGAIVLKKHKDWVKLLNIKSILYTAIAHLYQASALEEQGNYGCMIAFQQLSLQKIQSVGKISRNTPDVLKESVKNFTEYITQKLETSNSQNEQVFHELIPELESLEPAPGVELVKPLVFQPMDQKVVGTDIFARLIPMSAYEASSVYSEEKAKILRSVVASVEDKDKDLERFMSSLNIEEIDQAKAENPTLPAELLSQHQLLQGKRQDIDKVQNKVKELKALSDQVHEQLQSVTQKKMDDDNEEKQHQTKHGPRPESQVCLSMWKELQSLRKYHAQANNSNKELFNAFEKHQENLMLLAGDKNTLISAIPRMSIKDKNGQSNENRWKELMDKVDEMRHQRLTLLQQLRDQIGNDDITRAIIGELSNDQDALFHDHLQKHRNQADIIRQNLVAQDNILSALTEANAGHAQLRQAYHQMMKRREEWCVGLAKSAGCYTFLENKITEGLEFYSKLAESVLRLYKRCQEVIATRKRERLAIERKSSRTPSPAPPPSSNNGTPSDHTSNTPDSHSHIDDHTHNTSNNDNAQNKPGDHTPNIVDDETDKPHPPVNTDQEDVQKLILMMKQMQDEQKAMLETTPTAVVDNASLIDNDIHSQGDDVSKDPSNGHIPKPDDSLIPKSSDLKPDGLISILDDNIPKPKGSILIPDNYTSNDHIPVLNGPIPAPDINGDVLIPDPIPVPKDNTNDDSVTGQVPISQDSGHSHFPPTRPDKPKHLMGAPTGMQPNAKSIPNEHQNISDSPSIPIDSQLNINTTNQSSNNTVSTTETVAMATAITTPLTFLPPPPLSVTTNVNETLESTKQPSDAVWTSSDRQSLPVGVASISSVGVSQLPSDIVTTSVSVAQSPVSISMDMTQSLMGISSSSLMGVAQTGVAHSNVLQLEKTIDNQQKIMQEQTIKLSNQHGQLMMQVATIEELKKEILALKSHQTVQDKEKSMSSNNQAMLMKLLQQQQGLFTQQQSQLDKINKEGEARRLHTTELEMKLRDALAQEQFQNQSLQGQISQYTKEIQHLHQQLANINQQLHSVQNQAQQYLVHIQERDKALGNYRDEHRRIVDGIESQYKTRIQQLTQQLQEYQARGGVISTPTRLPPNMQMSPIQLPPSSGAPGPHPPASGYLQPTKPHPLVAANVPGPHPQPSNVPGPHPQPSNVPGPHPQPSNVPGPHPQPSNVPGPHPQPSNVPGPHPQPSTIPGPHPQSSNIPGPYPQSSNIPGPHPQPSIIPGPHPQSSIIPGPRPQPSNIPGPHPQPSIIPGSHSSSSNLTGSSTQQSPVPHSNVPHPSSSAVPHPSTQIPNISKNGGLMDMPNPMPEVGVANNTMLPTLVSSTPSAHPQAFPKLPQNPSGVTNSRVVTTPTQVVPTPSATGLPSPVSAVQPGSNVHGHRLNSQEVRPNTQHIHGLPSHSQTVNWPQSQTYNSQFQNQAQHGNMPPQAQHGNMPPQAQHGNMSPQAQHGNMPPQSYRRNMPPQHGNMPSQQHGNMPSQQHGNIPSQHGNMPSAHFMQRSTSVPPNR